MTSAKALVIPSEARDLYAHLQIPALSFRSAARNLVPVEKSYYVYLLANWNNNVLYVGMTNDLKRRVYEHQKKLLKGFTAKYNVNKLVYFEETRNAISALAREKEIKKWRREKKDTLVAKTNPSWNDLSRDL